MSWNFTSGSVPWRRARWLLTGLCLLACASLAEEDMEFIAFLGDLEQATEDAPTLLDWVWLLEQPEFENHESATSNTGKELNDEQAH